MDGFISKPFEVASAVASIRRHLRHPPPVLLPAGSVTSGTLAGAVAGDAWPDIDGIDTGDAQRRMGNDAALFHRMVVRWLRDPGDTSMPAAPLDAAAFAGCAMRMHRLKGSAGMLGANRIHALAGEAEAACRREDRAVMLDSMARLVDAIDRLKVAAAPLLLAQADAPPSTAAAVVAVGTIAAGSDLPPDAVSRRVALLREQDMAALDCFELLSPALRQRMDATEHGCLSEDLANLEFKRAAAVLDARFGGVDAQGVTAAREGLPNLV